MGASSGIHDRRREVDDMDRSELHRRIDRPPEGVLEAVSRAVDAVMMAHDPVLYALEHAPDDDEPLTPEEEGPFRRLGRQQRGEKLSPTKSC